MGLPGCFILLELACRYFKVGLLKMALALTGTPILLPFRPVSGTPSHYFGTYGSFQHLCLLPHYTPQYGI
jgi:hypothetical protein